MRPIRRVGGGTSTEQVRAKHCRPEPQGARHPLIRTGSKRGRSTRLPTGFKLDRWERFHHIEGDETDRAYQRIATLRKHYGPYRGEVKGEPPGTPSTIHIPHTKGMTPDREVVPAESEFAGSDQEGSDQEEGEITQTEGEGSGTFTQMRPRDSDSGSDETIPGRESWRSARGQELVVLSTPRPRGRGKRPPERREGAISK